VLSTLGVEAAKYGLLTLHRPSNVDDVEALRALVATLDDIAKKVPLVFPVHPRTRARMESFGVKLDASRWKLTEPIGYLDFVRLLASAKVVLTDSGGIQEETTVLGVPCITLRENTERPVTIDEGTNILAGTKRDRVLAAFEQALSGKAGRAPRFWDGKSAERIGDSLRKIFIG
jgi:UDP-N-acetylglucosamine 2-epimerase (non-hydrolysing)